MAKTEESMAVPPIYRHVPCSECVSFSLCKDIENRFFDQLQKNGGDYRSLRDLDGSRLASPVRRCVRTIFKEHATEFWGKEILEIGCGPLSLFSREFVQRNRIRYTGIEPKNLEIRGFPYFRSKFRCITYLNALIKRINYPIFYLLNLKEKYKKGPRFYCIPDYFPTPRVRGSFHIIYSSSSIEHWHEDLKGSSGDESWRGNFSDLQDGVQLYQRDIREVYKLLKENGKLIIDCPMHVHGNGIFYHGKVEMIREIFESVPWKKLTYEYWRADHQGLLPYMPFNCTKYWADRGLKVSNMWILNVVAEK